jgi:septum formation inhibitor MinC
MGPGPTRQAERKREKHPSDRYASGLRRGLVFAISLFLGEGLFAGAIAVAQSSAQTNSSPTTSTQTPAVKHRKKPASSHANVAATAAPVQPATPPPPPPPDWPANDRPSDAKITWDSKGLSIVAANSSLSQILKEVSTQTGATLQGFNQDERVFGEFGPGPARDVINQLLDGTGYNVLLIGEQGEGTPRQIVLTPRSGGASQPNRTNNRNQAPEEDTEAEQEAQQPEPPPPPPTPPPVQTGVAPGVPVRSQQEIIQELQQRQQQIQQQQQQNPQ